MKRRKPRGFDIDLADAVPKVTAEYLAFLQTGHVDAEADPKAFGARHTAAKTVLAHIEALIKLTGPPDDEAADRLGEGEELLREMRYRMHQEPEETPVDDEGNTG
ncbi:MAG: hypothetical protein JWR10_2097 [Rubritepida sp.]|nr:hypothetical protein [Rubritepida sp.]